MNTSVKLIIRKVKGAQASVHTIFLQYCYTSTKRVLISTSIAIPETYWDKSIGHILSSLPAIYGSASTLQEKLDHQRCKAEKIIRYAIKRGQGCPMQFLKRNIRLPDCWELDQMEDENNDLCVFYQIDRYLEDKKWMVHPATNYGYKNYEKASFFFSGVHRLQDDI
jgi:hypothetical protein